MAKRERLDKPTREVDLFMDSGVFPAWNRKTTINLHEYAGFLKRNLKYLSAYATVDEIPGEFGKKRTREQVEASAKNSYDNQQTLKSLGLKPIPIFHQGEKFSWLEQYLKDGEPYIGIATAKDLRNVEQREWLDHVFTILTDSNGVPFVKTHGFGITNIPLLMRYPWFTSDSTTWALAAGYGLLYVPPIVKGKFDFGQLPTRIIMSGRKQAAWSSVKRQYEGMPIAEKEWVDAWLKRIGIDVYQARFDPITRRSACLKYFKEFCENHPIVPFEHRQAHNWFEALGSSVKEMAGDLKWSRMSIIFATHMMNGQFSRIMSGAGARNRLISYWECIGKDDDVLHRYVKQGIVDTDYTPTAVSDDWRDDRYIGKRVKLLLERMKDE